MIFLHLFNHLRETKNIVSMFMVLNYWQHSEILLNMKTEGKVKPWPMVKPPLWPAFPSFPYDVKTSVCLFLCHYCSNIHSNVICVMLYALFFTIILYCVVRYIPLLFSLITFLHTYIHAYTYTSINIYE